MCIPVILQVSNEKESIPNRSFRMVNGYPVIEYLIRRLKKEDLQIIISTSTLEIDDVYEEIAQRYHLSVIRDQYANIVIRMKKACELYEGNHMIRVFANYPLLDIEEMITLYQAHVKGDYDYSYNEHQQGVLWGTGCEVFSKRLIEYLSQQNLKTSQQKTVSFYIRQNANRFNVLKFVRCERRKGFKLNLESEKDYEVISEIASNNEEISNDQISSYLDQHKILAKYNLEAPSKEVGLEKLYIHTHKVQSILTKSFDETYPISVELTLTNTCNLNCVYCSDKELRLRQGCGKSFDLEILKKLFRDLAKGGSAGVTFEGGGEPTLYPAFEEAVWYAKQQGLAVGLITNGTVRLSETILKEFEWIRVSLDASTAKEYVDLKGIDCFEQVISNIGYYAQHCGTVGVGYVVTKNNLSQIEALVMRLRELGATYIQLRPVVDCDELYPEGIDLSYLKFYQMPTFGVIIDGMTENAQSGNHDLPCVANGLTSIISGDGSVYVCGRLNIYDWLEPIGNILESDFEQIWNGDKRRQQCKMVQDAAFCSQNCPQCRISKFNQLFEQLKNIKSKSFI